MGGAAHAWGAACEGMRVVPLPPRRRMPPSDALLLLPPGCTSVPEKWLQAQQSCIDKHPDYVYKLWTDEDALQVCGRHACRARVRAAQLHASSS